MVPEGVFTSQFSGGGAPGWLGRGGEGGRPNLVVLISPGDSFLLQRTTFLTLNNPSDCRGGRWFDIALRSIPLEL